MSELFDDIPIDQQTVREHEKKHFVKFSGYVEQLRSQKRLAPRHDEKGNPEIFRLPNDAPNHFRVHFTIRRGVKRLGIAVLTGKVAFRGYAEYYNGGHLDAMLGPVGTDAEGFGLPANESKKVHRLPGTCDGGKEGVLEKNF
jgi:hypothetical protein